MPLKRVEVRDSGEEVVLPVLQNNNSTLNKTARAAVAARAGNQLVRESIL